MESVKPYFKVLQSAPLMYFQDLGRSGYMHVGMSPGGAVDLHAHCWANHLLGNDVNAVTLEITMGNATFMALEDVVISLTGAEMNARIDGVEVRSWAVHKIKKGETLKLGYARNGCHAYMAISGGFSVQQLLGSGSTVVRNDIGGFIQVGDDLLASDQLIDNSLVTKFTPSVFVPDYHSVSEIRIIFPEGQDEDLCSLLLDSEFTVSPESDRMGRKLISDNELPVLSGIISEGVSLGAIQLPPNGELIVLLNDRQTQGGYTKVGNVARVDLPLLVQMMPSSKFKFVSIRADDAADEWVDFVRFFRL